MFNRHRFLQVIPATWANDNGMLRRAGSHRRSTTPGGCSDRVRTYSRMIVGWQLATHMRTALALDALEMAIWRRNQEQADVSGLVHHSDRGVQYLAIRYGERLADAGAVSSVGSRGDSYDNALAESFNGLFKTELIRPQGPWRGLDDLELAVREYVDWFNHRRLHGPQDQRTQPPLNPGRFRPAATDHAGTTPLPTPSGSVQRHAACEARER